MFFLISIQLILESIERSPSLNFTDPGGTTQAFSLYSTVVNTANTTLNGKRLGLFMNNANIALYNSTDSEWLWTAYTTANKPTPAAIGALSDVIAGAKTVSLPANTSSLSVTAPTVSGYTFVCWLQPAGSGHTDPGYMQDPRQSTTNLWSAVGTTTGARSWLCTALYKAS